MRRQLDDYAVHIARREYLNKWGGLMDKSSRMDKKWLRRVIVTASVVFAVIALTLALAAMYIRAPEIKLPPQDNEGTEPKIVQAKKEDVPSPVQTQTGDKELPEGHEPVLAKGDRRKGVYTILLIGTSDGYSSDTLMVGTIDAVEKTVCVLSIPRDTKVEASRSLKKINGALGYGGTSLVRKEVAGLLGFTPDFTIKIDLDGLIHLVDAIGGVDFDIPHKMNYDDPTQDLHIHFEPGLQHLDGQAAMELVRYRGYVGSDFRRMEVQQEFLKIVAQKVLSPSNITKIDQLAKIYAENVETDLTVGNLIWLGLQGYEIGAENIEMATLPTYTKDADVNPSYYQYVSSKEAIELINSTVNPYREKITAENVSHVPFEAPLRADAADKDMEVTEEGITIIHVDLTEPDDGDRQADGAVPGDDGDQKEPGSEEPDSGS